MSRELLAAHRVIEERDSQLKELDEMFHEECNQKELLQGEYDKLLSQYKSLEVCFEFYTFVA